MFQSTITPLVHWDNPQDRNDNGVVYESPIFDHQ